MKMYVWQLALIAWEFLGLFGYILFQYTQRKYIYPYHWELRDRIGCGSLCVVFGPVALGLAIWIYLDNTIDWQKQVKW